nr:MAG TPA: hypothetical protein [Caudoviricetes sp.]
MTANGGTPTPPHQGGGSATRPASRLPAKAPSGRTFGTFLLNCLLVLSFFHLSIDQAPIVQRVQVPPFAPAARR